MHSYWYWIGVAFSSSLFELIEQEDTVHRGNKKKEDLGSSLEHFSCVVI